MLRLMPLSLQPLGSFHVSFSLVVLLGLGTVRTPSLLALMALVGLMLIELLSWAVA